MPSLYLDFRSLYIYVLKRGLFISIYSEWGKPDEEEGKKEKPKVIDQANFGLSGALATDENTGNMYKGVLMKVSCAEKNLS